jgi:hypothetical protein
LMTVGVTKRSHWNKSPMPMPSMLLPPREPEYVRARDFRIDHFRLN